MRVDHVGGAIAGVAARQQAVGRRDTSAGGGALVVVVVVVVGAELVFIGFHSSWREKGIVERVRVWNAKIFFLIF